AIGREASRSRVSGRFQRGCTAGSRCARLDHGSPMPVLLEFRVLGPLEVRSAGVPLALGGPRQRALLAALLCRANQVVSRDRLIDELAVDRSSGPAERVLAVQVSRLRKALAE